MEVWRCRQKKVKNNLITPLQSKRSCDILCGVCGTQGVFPTRTRTTKKRTKTMAKKIEVKAELVSNPVEEWTEWRVYMGKKQVASFTNPETAELMARNLKACAA